MENNNMTYETLNQMTKYELIKIILANNKQSKPKTSTTERKTNTYQKPKPVPFVQRSDAEKKAYFESIGKMWLSKEEWMAQNAKKQKPANIVSRNDLGLDEEE